MRNLHKYRASGVAAALLGGVLALSIGAFGPTSASTYHVTTGSQLRGTCSSALSSSNRAAKSERVSCADHRAGTTSTARPTTTASSSIGGNGSSKCPQFLELPSARQAFCDPMATPDPQPGFNTGDLDGTVWGVDRMTGNDNPGQNLMDNWPQTIQDQCGTNVQVSNLDDINMCGTGTVESSNDGGSQSELSLYPRQPFNFATGTQVFEVNVSDNSASSHSAWPDIAITSTPAPNPDGSPIMDGNMDPANSVGVDLTGNSDTTGAAHCIGAQIWATREYQRITIPQTDTGCALASTSDAAQGSAAEGPMTMNHVELVISAGSMSVYMSDAGTLTMHLLASASFPLPLTQGLVWIEDQHYNGSKYCQLAPGGQCQQTDTFEWSDFAFSGPLEPRDLGFQVPDNTAAGPAETSGDGPSGLPSTNIGYVENSSGMATVSTSPQDSPTAADIAKASGALLVLDYNGFSNAGTFTYRVNGTANTFDNSTTLAAGADGQTTPSAVITVPVPLSEVVPGVNTFGLSMSNPWAEIDFSNISLILQGAGGVVPPGAGSSSAVVLARQSVTFNSDGGESVFWRGGRGQLMRDYFTGSGAWLGPQALGGSLASLPTAIATSPSGLDVFYVGTSGRVFHSYFTGTKWVKNLPLPGSAAAGNLTATHSADGTESVFWRGVNGQLVRDYLSGSGTWLGPQVLAGSLASDPTAIATRGNGLDVFYAGAGGGLFHSYSTGTEWVENLPLPGSSAASGLTATYGSSGYENVFWENTQHELMHDYFPGSGPWVSGLIATSDSEWFDPGAIATNPYGLDVFYLADQAGVPTHSYFATPFTKWQTGFLPGSAVSDLVVPVLTRNGGEDAFFSTTSGGLYHDYFTGSGPWIGASPLPT